MAAMAFDKVGSVSDVGNILSHPDLDPPGAWLDSVKLIGTSMYGGGPTDAGRLR